MKVFSLWDISNGLITGFNEHQWKRTQHFRSISRFMRYPEIPPGLYCISEGMPPVRQLTASTRRSEAKHVLVDKEVHDCTLAHALTTRTRTCTLACTLMCDAILTIITAQVTTGALRTTSDAFAI